MKKLLTLFVMLSVGLVLQAQPPAKVLRQTTKATATKSSAGKFIAPAPLSGVKISNKALQSTTRIKALPTYKRSWLEQQKRNWKAHQLHKQRQTRDLEAAIHEQERTAREALLAKLPKANLGHQFVTKDFANLLPTQIIVEELPLVAQPQILYRGLALPADGKALENILQNGLRIADVGIEANTRNLAMSGGMPGAGRALAKAPVTNLTSFPLDAANWAVTRLTDKKPLIAIVAVNGQPQTGKIVLADKDIPAQQITHVFVPLIQEGKSVWCNVELTSQGEFLVTPYDIIPTAQ